MGDTMRTVHKKQPISSFQIITFSFLAVILIGALLLMLPFATKDGEGASLIDALFTATSATCVTGLIVQDTATYWSLFGHIVILCMIQIGGMGVMTMALMISKLAGKRIGLMQRSVMQESISAPTLGGIVQMTRFIFIAVLVIELTGTVVLATVFCPQFGFGQGLWYALFHSVSAFCNAGFDLMGIGGKFSSFTAYTGNAVVNITIMVLIVVGGLGFFVWDDILKNKWRFRKYRLQSKVVLIVTAILLVLPAIYFFFAEFTNFSINDRIFASLFQSVTLRTAGFNSVDFALVSEVGILLMIALMLVGGSPGSTAGGMKTTTLAVLCAAAWSVFTKKDEAQMFRRRIADSTVKQAATVLWMYVILFFTSGLLISAIDGVPVITALFETSSAVATVGVTMGITPQLSTVSHLILIALMYLGRVGGLTLVFAAFSERKTNAKYPQERITVG